MEVRLFERVLYPLWMTTSPGPQILVGVEIAVVLFAQLVRTLLEGLLLRVLDGSRSHFWVGEDAGEPRRMGDE